MDFYSCRRSINYVKHILKKYAVPADISSRHTISVAPEHLDRFFRLFWDLLQCHGDHFHSLEASGPIPTERPVDEIERTGIYLYISKSMVDDVTERLNKFRLSWTEVGTKIRCDSVLVLEAENVKARYALVRELTSEFQDLAIMNEKNPYTNTFELHGSAVAQVLLGGADTKPFDVLRPGPVKQFPRVRLPWRRQLHDLLRDVNLSTNEPELYGLFRKAVAEIRGAIITAAQKRKAKGIKRRAKHARIQYAILKDILYLKPERRDRSNDYFFSSVRFERTTDHPWLNIEAQILYQGKARWNVNVSVEDLREFLKLKQELKFGRELFVNNYGKTFRNDDAVRVWIKNYRARNSITEE